MATTDRTGNDANKAAKHAADDIIRANVGKMELGKIPPFGDRDPDYYWNTAGMDYADKVLKKK